METGFVIRSATLKDAARIRAIYNHYVANATCTFEEEAVSLDTMQARIADVLTRYPWLVGERGNELIGYAYATAWKPRSAYRFSVETTVYAAPTHLGEGVGSSLYPRLLDELRELGMHTALAIIALPNPASAALHERMGFTQVGLLKQAGYKFGKWIDSSQWQLML